VKDNIKKLLILSKDTAQNALNKLRELDHSGEKDYSFSLDIPREIKARADVVIEQLILEQLRPTGIDILSEESGLIQGEQTSNLRFIVDPIDGSVNFVRGILECSISIALFDGEKPIFGVLASYPSGKVAWGGKTIGAFLANDKLSVSTINKSEKGILCTGFPSRFNFDDKSISSHVYLMAKFSKTRMLGSASQSLLQVAKGAAEAYFESNIMIWDVAAGLAIVEGAGGKFNIKIKKSYETPVDVFAHNNVIEKILG